MIIKYKFMKGGFVCDALNSRTTLYTACFLKSQPSFLSTDFKLDTLLYIMLHYFNKQYCL